MTDSAALLAAILADPAEDTPRLVYADCIEEQGEPERAEFIRVQVELSRLMPNRKCPKCNSYGGPCDYCEFEPVETLRRREWELLSADNVRRWFLNSGIRSIETRVTSGQLITEPQGFLSRGFVSALTCSWDAWRTHADAITRAQPIEKVKLTTVPHFRRETVDGTGHIVSIEGIRGHIRFGGSEVDEWQTTYRGPYCEAATVIRNLLSVQWPRVTFELPPERSRDPYGQDVIDDIMRGNLNAPRPQGIIHATPRRRGGR